MSHHPPRGPLRAARRSLTAAFALAAAAGATAALPALAPAAEPLPGGRAIELVSPPDTNNESARPGPFLSSNPRIFHDGRVALSQLFTSAFPDTGNGWGAIWQSVRSPQGWTRTSLESPVDGQLGRWHFDVMAGTPDLSRTLVRRMTLRSTLGEGPTYRFRGPTVLELREASGERTTIASIPVPDDEPIIPQIAVAGSSDDLRTVTFATKYGTPEGTQPSPEGRDMVYLWRHGKLQLAADAAGGPDPACGGQAYDPETGSLRSVSTDGSVAYVMHAERIAGGGCSPVQIYVRAGDRMWRVNAPEPGVAPAFGGSDLFGVSPDGRIAYFSSDVPLTATDSNTGTDLYRSDLPAGGGDPTVTCITCAWGGADGVGVNRSGMVSGDGSTVLFRASQPIDGQGVPPVFGYETNLFALRDGKIRLVSDSASLWGLGNNVGVNLTPDGRSVLFRTPNNVTGIDTGGTEQLYRATLGDDGTYGLSCVSCDPGGAPPIGNVLSSVSNLNSFISDDGRTVAFASVDALTPTATAGVSNLYVWEDGKLGLMHTGATRTEPLPLGVSPDGNDVYFDAYGALTHETQQTTNSMYNARRGGGFPLPVLPPAPCSGEGCRPVPTPQPAPTPVATVAFGGGDDSPAPRAGKVRALKPKVKGRSLRVDIKAPGAGRLSITGSRVRSLTRTVTKQGTARMAVQLTSDARKILTRRKRVKVTLKVTFRPAGGGAASSARLSVTVKR